MSYVPPHLRNRKEKKDVKNVVDTEAEFPPFVQHKPVDFNGPSFASKVSHTQKDLGSVEVHKEFKPVFSSIRKKYEAEHETEFEPIEEDEYEPQPTESKPKEDDGWKVVERKIRVKKDKVQDALDNGDAPLEEEDVSAWDEQPEEYETYWDDRRH